VYGCLWSLAVGNKSAYKKCPRHTDKRFPQAWMFTPTLTEKIHRYRIATKVWAIPLQG
jgi:hypothetical protein